MNFKDITPSNVKAYLEGNLRSLIGVDNISPIVKYKAVERALSCPECTLKGECLHTDCGCNIYKVYLVPHKECIKGNWKAYSLDKMVDLGYKYVEFNSNGKPTNTVSVNIDRRLKLNSEIVSKLEEKYNSEFNSLIGIESISESCSCTTTNIVFKEVNGVSERWLDITIDFTKVERGSYTRSVTIYYLDNTYQSIVLKGINL